MLSSKPGPVMPDAPTTSAQRRYPVRQGNDIAKRMLLLQSTNQPVKDVVCAKCLYPVRGLPSDSCPECGSHLTTNGVLHPRWSTFWQAPIALTATFMLIAISALSVVAFAVLSNIANGMAPERIVSNTVFLTSDGELLIQSAVNTSYAVPPETSTLWLYGPQVSPALTIDIRRQTITSDAMRRPRPLNAETLNDWLTRHNFTLSYDQLDELLAWFDHNREIPQPSAFRSRSTHYQRTRPNGGLACCIAGLGSLILWLTLYVKVARWSEAEGQRRAERKTIWVLEDGTLCP